MTLTATAAGVAAAASGTAATAPGAGSKPVAEPSQGHQSTALFRQTWRVYRKLLEVDFLEHTPLYAALTDLLLQQYSSSSSSGDGNTGSSGSSSSSRNGGPISMLAWGVAMQCRLLVRCRNAAALAVRCSWRATPEWMSLHQRWHSHTTTLPSCRQRAARFRLWSLEGKAELVAQVARCLKPGGMFVLVDVFMREDEGREQYMVRYCENIAQAVQQGIIEGGEAQLLLDHVCSYDFPEKLSSYASFSPASGSASLDCLFTDSKQFGRLVVLKK